MRYSTPYAIICGTLVALAAISAATVAVVQGSIDGASFSAIIGAAIGGVSFSAGSVIATNLNGPKSKDPKEI